MISNMNDENQLNMMNTAYKVSHQKLALSNTKQRTPFNTEIKNPVNEDNLDLESYIEEVNDTGIPEDLDLNCDVDPDTMKIPKEYAIDPNDIENANSQVVSQSMYFDIKDNSSIPQKLETFEQVIGERYLEKTNLYQENYLSSLDSVHLKKTTFGNLLKGQLECRASKMNSNNQHLSQQQHNHQQVPQQFSPYNIPTPSYSGTFN